MKEEIICILDASASMIGTKQEALEGIRQFVSDQKKIGDPNMTLVWFSGDWEVAYEGKLKYMPEIRDWPLKGMTALNDAIGKTINHVKERFSREKPDKVILAILTDGCENDSKEFTRESAADLIKHHKDKYGWDVKFLAADQDAVAVGNSYSIDVSNAINYSSLDTRKGFSDLSASVFASRV